MSNQEPPSEEHLKQEIKRKLDYLSNVHFDKF
jgi:hypothetical protein